LTHEELIKLIEERFPPSLSEEWDNSGLQVGPFEGEVKVVGLALNPSLFSIKSAIEKGCDFLLVHHPLIFPSIRRIDTSTAIGKVIEVAFSHRITLYALHTPWDVTSGGSSDYWADLIGLGDRCPILPARSDSKIGIGRIGRIESVSFDDMVSFLKRQVNFLLPVQVGRKEISKVAICSGSGGDLLDRVIALGADLYITSDLKYHQVLKALNAGVNLLILSHHEMEERSLIYLERELKKLVFNIDLNLLKERDPLLS